MADTLSKALDGCTPGIAAEPPPRLLPQAVYNQQISGVEDVLHDRGAVYGSFHDNAVIAQALKDVFRSAPGWSKLNASQQEALDLKAMKISRILSGDPDYVDNWTDDAGYSTLIVKELNERKTP